MCSADLDRRANLILEEALEIADDRRSSLLEERCGGDVELRRLVARLLAAVEMTDGGRTPLMANAGSARSDRATCVGPGTRIGSFEVIEELGRGGMARVYRAQRREGGFEQVVAIKVLDGELGGVSLARRFEQERQILAGLVHPNIATVLDGGSLPDGSPYFMLEYIDGVPIDVATLEQPLERRLRLLATVARAVQHAHRALVVHRDLKPSNILVAKDGTVKLLDFGIAKVLSDAGPASGVAATATSVRLLTPLWASPEQVLGEPITTASDIYQLGLLLYHLVCGAPAHALRDTSWSELQRVICEEPPPRPSTVVRRAGQRIRPELEAIILHALDKVPTGRYGSAEDLARDLDRLLSNQPVLARSQTVAYRTRKFVQRHALGVGLAAALAAVLLTSLGLLTVQSRHIAAQRDEARREHRHATAIGNSLAALFDQASPFESGERPSARDLVARGAERVERELADQPDVLVDLLVRLAWASNSLGDYEQALDLANRVLARAAPLGPSSLDRAEALLIVGTIESGRGHRLLANAALRSSIAAADATAPAGSIVALDARRGLAKELAARNDLQSARDLVAEVIAARRRADDANGLATDLRVLGSIELDRGQLEAAAAALGEARALLVQRFGVDDLRVAGSSNDLAFVSEKTGDFADAERLLREVLDVKRAVLRPGHSSIAVSVHNLARVLFRQGRLEEAAALAREASALWQAELGDDHPQTLLAQFNWGLILREQNRLHEAEALFARQPPLLESLLGRDHPRRRSAAALLALTWLDLADPARARAIAMSLGPADSHGSEALLAGRLAMLDESVERAAATFEQVIDGAPGPTNARLRLEASYWLAVARQTGAQRSSSAEWAALREQLAASTPRLAELARGP